MSLLDAVSAVKPRVVLQTGGSSAHSRHDSILPRKCLVVVEHRVGRLLFCHHYLHFDVGHGALSTIFILVADLVVLWERRRE